ncbi:transporter [Candidatus Epulonipiscium fishelsonii]|uniref:Transporter n=1 Tax=Candidatus Epulonipiscium fishelsonii TaxID=77094 RepID=A0ACC8XES9_9FIRM|nr:transporter [Epulopiscium sp. SCG-B11WGA-EpuloA1]ONI43953.1 transporter [Epulopiscium sp. SCG-B05WGA-EpuloA1]
MLSLQIGLVFVGSIVGAGLSSGRELTQFFAVYGYKSFIGVGLCGLMYIWVCKMIIELSIKYQITSYKEFIDLVCPRPIAIFTNIFLTIFLLSNTSVILAGSGAVVNQFFGVPTLFGVMLMIVISIIFLMRETQGLYEVNNITVPILICIMSTIFISYMMKRPEQASFTYLQSLDVQKTNWLWSSFVYAGFNIISIVGIIVPLATEIKNEKIILKGVAIGSLILTIISVYIVFLMMVNPTYVKEFEIPILAVAHQVTPYLQVALLIMVWLEMFSSQISNVYSLTKSLQSKVNIKYEHAIVLSILVALPLSTLGFKTLVDVLYPVQGVLSLGFLVCLIYYYTSNKFKVSLTLPNTPGA